MQREMRHTQIQKMYRHIRGGSYLSLHRCLAMLLLMAEECHEERAFLHDVINQQGRLTHANRTYTLGKLTEPEFAAALCHIRSSILLIIEEWLVEEQ